MKLSCIMKKDRNELYTPVSASVARIFMAADSLTLGSSAEHHGSVPKSRHFLFHSTIETQMPKERE
ncbi:Hypothetical predicted protein [Podarcis lilfordi]|uniref:Uncharacterized protein n=1 Tax=Podarcis lilfordi TaxID=74358 RepID=A0AA35K6U5_9SAUR|nr:Hypothetical predicted protein [Podarcis lilfordi]